QEEAMKDKTGRVVAQLPVKVATFLLNEKREAIRAFEQRHRVGILLIPNESLEAPHFKLSRLRVEELSEAQRLSYTLAEDYEEQYEAQVNAAMRETIEEPAVKSVAPTSPAPLPPAPKPKPEVNASFFRWLWGNLFGQPEQPSIKEERPGRSSVKPAKPERQRRERLTNAPVIKTDTTPGIAETPPPLISLPIEESLPEPKRVAEVVTTTAAKQEEITTPVEEEETSGRNRRGRRGGRRRKRGEAADTVPVNTETLSGANAGVEPDDHSAIASESVAPTITTTSSAPQRRIRSGRPRLPREALAAQVAAKSTDATVLLNDELPTPPLTRLEYPTVEEEVKETQVTHYPEPEAPDEHPKSEAPAQPVNQAEAPGMESADFISELPKPVEPVFTEAETAVAIDAETVQVPLMLEVVDPEADGTTLPATLEVEAEIEETVVVEETVVSEEAIVNEPSAGSEPIVEKAEHAIPVSEPSLITESANEPVEASQVVEPSPVSSDNDAKS
ncbi:MAG: hypothetical protein KDJ31_08425, partial [Candidatus Competibacteraceae bacterium]|nr:hypothetical protein [Candidatus Competibacteraceae bacterium]